MARCLACLAVLVVALAGCEPSAQPVESASQPPIQSATLPIETGSTSISRPSPTTGGGSSPAPSSTPPARATTWFTPMPYAPAGATDAIDGSVDFDQLFDGSNQWPLAAAATDVVKLYSGWVEWHATAEQLRAIVSATRARGQHVALEIGPLFGTGSCGLDVEGFNASLTPIRRIHDAGGTVSYVAFDEPYAFGHLYEGPRACHWSVERVAQETASFVRALRMVEPTIQIGDIEPLWTELSPTDLASWMDAYRDAAGEPFDFMHLDVDWALDEWPAWVAAAGREIDSRDVTLGVIYNGGYETSDRAWTDAARKHVQAVEQLFDRPPAQVIFQSWMHYPRRVLPESDLSTFTGLLRQYTTAQRAQLIVSPTGPHGLAGRATSVAGVPLAGAALEISALPLDGGYTELVATGTVPAGARSALVGFRVNTEGAGPGAVRFGVYGVSYAEAGSAKNVVPDPRFARGAGAWDIDGTASVRFTPSDRGAARMARISAKADEILVMNGSEFRVTPGRRFDLVARVKAPALSPSPPLLVLVLLGRAEVSRTSVPIQPAERAIDTVVTDASGAFSIRRPDLAGRLRLEIRYAGDLGTWPASEELTLDAAG